MKVKDKHTADFLQTKFKKKIFFSYVGAGEMAQCVLSCRGPRLGAQHPHWAAHSHL